MTNSSNLNGYQCLTAIHSAVESGYRHFDTAFNHENERQIGEALRTQIQMGNVSRENIFLTTKLWNIHHDPRDVRRICEHQLNLLGFEYIDLYLMQFPVGYRHMCDEILTPINDISVLTTDVDYVDTWRAMEELVKLGLVRSIGLSNFNMEQIQRIIQCSSSKPVVNQIEIWPGFMQKDLVDYCRYNGIVVTAFAPLGQPNREKHTPIYFFSEGMKRLVKKYKRSAAQIVLRYLVDYGVIPIPKAGNPLHIKENLKIFDFKLEEIDIRALRGIKSKERLVQYENIKNHKFYPFERED
ncbi:aldo-keto reductase family 1 member A1-A [Drosophila willistoni]|uniref:aldo-keto reductase family 1 member A1-A n=1 Tax=Drosophila willistoni TaxID=7260 RepID=UPI001F08337B|nr:aldo-keto reductase family 1 member A1-A [Drosophila willistoni]